MTSVVLLGNMASSLALQVVFLLPNLGRAQVQFQRTGPDIQAAQCRLCLGLSVMLVAEQCQQQGRFGNAVLTSDVKLGGGALREALVLTSTCCSSRETSAHTRRARAHTHKLITSVTPVVGNQLPPLACADTRH